MECPRCGTTNPAQAVSCGSCGRVFKAYGHPGVNLFTAPEGEVLCDTCRYHQEGSCDLPNYPQATQCTLYRDIRRPAPAPITYRPRGNWGWLVGIVALAAASLWLTLR